MAVLAYRSLVQARKSKHQSKNRPQGSVITLVPRVGLEPTALGLEVLCSIQLSYQGSSEFTLNSATILQASGKIDCAVNRYSSSQLNLANRGELQLV